MNQVSSVFKHILNNYDNILNVMGEQLSKAEQTMELILESNETVPTDILKFYNTVSDARAHLKDSYLTLLSIKEI